MLEWHSRRISSNSKRNIVIGELLEPVDISTNFDMRFKKSLGIPRLLQAWSSQLRSHVLEEDRVAIRKSTQCSQYNESEEKRLS